MKHHSRPEFYSSFYAVKLEFFSVNKAHYGALPLTAIHFYPFSTPLYNFDTVIRDNAREHKNHLSFEVIFPI